MEKSDVLMRLPSTYTPFLTHSLVRAQTGSNATLHIDDPEQPALCAAANRFDYKFVKRKSNIQFILQC